MTKKEFKSICDDLGRKLGLITVDNVDPCVGQLMETLETQGLMFSGGWYQTHRVLKPLLLQHPKGVELVTLSSVLYELVCRASPSTLSPRKDPIYGGQHHGHHCDRQNNPYAYGRYEREYRDNG